MKKLGEKVKDSRREMRAKERQIAVSESLLKIRQPVVFIVIFFAAMWMHVYDCMSVSCTQVLKGLSNLAKRLQGKIGALKQKKVRA